MPDGVTNNYGSGVSNPPNPKQRYGDMKPNLALVPAASTIYEALALMEGARKYGPYNWRHNAVEAMTYVAACMRHLADWVDGEDIDPESLKPHLGHAKACLGILIDALETGNLIDNRPPKGAAPKVIRRWSQEPPAPSTNLRPGPGELVAYRQEAFPRQNTPNIKVSWADPALTPD